MKCTLSSRSLALVLAGMMAAGLVIVGCSSEDDVSIASVGMTYSQTNLVADLNSFVPTPLNIDPNLLNGWGLAMDMSGNFAVAANHSGMGLFYDNLGHATLPAIQIPPLDGPGAPAGQVFNSTNEFFLPGSDVRSQFIYSTEDGTICAGVPGTVATVVAGPLDDGAVYKGLALAMLGGRAYLYATNFGDHRIDVFDGKWNWVVSFPFMDPNIPADYSPFGITNIDGKLWVSYAIPKPPDYGDDLAGPGHGIIDIFNPNGSFVRRFYSHGVLNSPWGMTMAPDGFGAMRKMILVGNFGDGSVNAFDNSGKFMGSLMTPAGAPIMIPGLWAINAPQGRGMNKVYFTAGPNEESDGLFGYLTAEQ